MEEEGYYYLYGIHKHGRVPLVTTLARTTRGWTSRSSVSHLMRHDYVSYETLEDVGNWIHRHDMPRYEIMESREAAVARLATLIESSASLPETLVAGDPAKAPTDAAERVLQHLERGL